MKQDIDGVLNEYVKDSVSSQVQGAVIKALRRLDFQQLVGEAVRDHLDNSLRDLTFPKNSIKAESINFENYQQVHKNFTSTGIEDRSTSIELSILDGNVVVENTLVAQGITTQKNIDVGQRVKSKSLNVTEGTILNDAVVLGKAKLQGITEFTSTVKFTGPTHIDNVGSINFKDGTIPHGAINWTDFVIPQAQIQTDKVENFSSTGITDNANSTQINVNDNLVSITGDLEARKVRASNITLDGKVETGTLIVLDGSQLAGYVEVQGTLLASNNVDIHGKLTVLNGLDVRGEMIVPDTLKNELVEYMSANIKLESIVPEGGQIQIGKRVVLDEHTLGGTITHSNLRKVGTLSELEVAGEARLANNIYFSPLGRIGVNTDEPTAPLDVWDEEVQITVGKNKSKTAWFGTGREHNLELGVNRDTKVTITPAQTIIKNPVFNDRAFTDSPDVPGWKSNVGDICWSQSPIVGGPIGWVCLGNTRWAKFGEITDE
jgi:cytoskeletal protein CcmA (bactofilin family)